MFGMCSYLSSCFTMFHPAFGCQVSYVSFCRLVAKCLIFSKYFLYSALPQCFKLLHLSSIFAICSLSVSVFFCFSIIEMSRMPIFVLFVTMFCVFSSFYVHCQISASQYFTTFHLRNLHLTSRSLIASHNVFFSSCVTMSTPSLIPDTLFYTVFHIVSSSDIFVISCIITCSLHASQCFIFSKCL